MIRGAAVCFVPGKIKHMWKGFEASSLGSQRVGCMGENRDETGMGAGKEARVPAWLQQGEGEGARKTLLPIWCVLQAPF